MQSNQSYLLAYLQSIRSGSGAALSGNGNDDSSNNNNAISTNNTRTTNETESKRSYSPHSKSTIQSPSHSRTNQIIHQGRGDHTIGTIGTSSAHMGTSDEELNVAQMRTAALLNQYFTRQEQVERREKLLLEQQISSAFGTSPLIRPILQQFQQQQQQQALQLRQLNTSLSSSTYDNLILELLHQNQDSQRVRSIQDLQQIQPLLSSEPSLSTVHRAELNSMNQLQQQIQQLQQIEAHDSMRTLRMNITERSDANREPSALIPVQGDSATLLSNFDAMTQVRILNSLQDIRQSSLTSLAIEQMHRQNATRLLASNTSPNSLEMTGDTITASNNDRKLYASASVPTSGNDNKKVIHRMGRVGKFPLKLHTLLNELKEQGRTDVAAFLPHGLAFSIYNTSEFANNIMPLHFRMSRYSSFQRQLNLYDFQRITEGPDKGAYHHHLFIERQPELLCGMKRNKIKGIAGKQQPNKLDAQTASLKVASAANNDADRDEQDDVNETDDESGMG